MSSPPEIEKANDWMRIVKEEGFIVAITERIFYFLQWMLSPLYHKEFCLTLYRDSLANKRPEKKRRIRHTSSIIYRDMMMTIWFTITGIVLPLLFLFAPRSFTLLASYHSGAFIGVWGILEILQHHINFILFQNIRRRCMRFEKYPRDILGINALLEKLLGFRQMEISKDVETVTSVARRLIFAVMDYWRLIVFSAILSSSLPRGAFSRELTSFGETLYFQIVTATTLGYGEIHPVSGPAMVIVSFQVLSAFLFTLIAVAYVISLLPRMEIISGGDQE
ncbi:MAG: hypothetical protein GHCLOJNM_00187 [bacterium]|nr:hypothetical protein [bacterium]